MNIEYYQSVQQGTDEPDYISIAQRIVSSEEQLYYRLMQKLDRARKLHPVFAEGVYQGLGRISEEFGELSQTINHGESSDRMEEEAMDLLVVVWRFVMKEYETSEDATNV